MEGDETERSSVIVVIALIVVAFAYFLLCKDLLSNSVDPVLASLMGVSIVWALTASNAQIRNRHPGTKTWREAPSHSRPRLQ